MDTSLMTARKLREDLILLPHHEGAALEHGLVTNCYAALCGPHAILVDAVFADSLPAIHALAQAGHTPTALVLTHRHVVPQAETLPEIVRQYQIPVFLHPNDAAHPQARRWRDLRYADPTDSPLLAECGLQALLFAGHTEGHIMLYREAAGGLLLTGDCAVGPKLREAEEDDWTMTRPPLSFNVNDTALRNAWIAFQRPVAALCPYHGLPVVDRADAIVNALESLRREQPTIGL